MSITKSRVMIKMTMMAIMIVMDDNDAGDDNE